jgi:Fic family protein
MAEYVTMMWKGSYSGLSRRARVGGRYDTYHPDMLASRSFILSGDVAADISDAERAIVELNNSVQALSNTEALARLLLRAEALSSSRIEGLVVGARRVMKAELDADSRDLTAQEVLDNITAMDLALSQALAEKLTLATILDIHRALTENTHLAAHAGRIRTEQNWLGGNAYNPCGASYVPPPADLVPAYMDDLIGFINSDNLSPLTQAAIAHAQFETIHPFADGNGRTGRALIHLILRRRGLCPRVVPPISLILATLGRDYIRELAAFRHTGSPEGETAFAGLSSWLSFFADCGIRACNNALSFEQRIASLKQGWIDSLGRPASATIGLMLDAIIGRPLFDAKHMKRVTGKSLPTVNAAIDQLKDAGIIKQTNAGKRNRVFEAVGVLDIFTDFERNLGSPAEDTAVEKPVRPVPYPL